MFNKTLSSLIFISTLLYFNLAISRTNIRNLERTINRLNSKLLMLENKVLNDEFDLRNDFELIWQELNKTESIKGKSSKEFKPAFRSKIESDLMKIPDKLLALQHAFAEEKKMTRKSLDIMELELSKLSLQIDVLRELKEKMTNKKSENEIHELQQELSRNKRALNELTLEVKQSRELIINLYDESLIDYGTWERNGFSCYKVFKYEVKWNNAVEKCQLENSFLVEIDNDAENNYVIDLFKLTTNTEKEKYGYDYYDYIITYYDDYQTPSDTYTGPWIGASDIETEGEWIWHHQGRNLRAGFQDWRDGEPNGNTTENCLHLQETANLKWDDSPCDYIKPFVCEKPVKVNTN